MVLARPEQPQLDELDENRGENSLLVVLTDNVDQVNEYYRISRGLLGEVLVVAEVERLKQDEGVVQLLLQEFLSDISRMHVSCIEPVDEQLEHRLNQVAIHPVVEDVAEEAVLTADIVNQAMLEDDLMVLAICQHHVDIGEFVLILQSQ